MCLDGRKKLLHFFFHLKILTSKTLTSIKNVVAHISKKNEACTDAEKILCYRFEQHSHVGASTRYHQ